MVCWKDIDVVIPAVLSIPGRANSLRDLLTALAKQCPGIQVRILPQYHRPPNIAKHAFKILTAGLRDFTRPWVVYLEEDVKLSSDFGKHLPATLDVVDDDVGAVSFFSMNPEDIEHIRNGVHFYNSDRPFIFAQCIALRREVAEAWGRHLIPWQERAPKNKYALDMALGDCCDEMGVRLLVHLPSLVQHRADLPSAFGHTARPLSRSFQEHAILESKDVNDA